ncbi:hypothetical protein [Streptomyces griseofuscus]|uniref:Uncharacterized protein n=1 Tax=Streptomyces griseofuscus TaxID=146922 RepID=A0A7H1Q3Q5_9ACTN|nr:hypothetical protein [Streptomyces griseofuscus]QNT94935.1 hypothetical protein HEP81_04663 [Streptomyces griseofuscus]
MGCNCGKNRQARQNGDTSSVPKPEMFEAVIPGGKVVFKHSNVETVKAIANRYLDAQVREQSSGRIVHTSTKQSATTQ